MDYVLEYSLKVGTGRILLDENVSGCVPHYCCNEYWSLPFGTKKGVQLNETDSLKQVHGQWVKLKYSMPVDAAWAEIVIFDNLVNLTDPAYNITLVFENETSPNPVLEEITIPSASPIFEKLIG